MVVPKLISFPPAVAKPITQAVISNSCHGLKISLPQATITMPSVVFVAKPFQKSTTVFVCQQNRQGPTATTNPPLPMIGAARPPVVVSWVTGGTTVSVVAAVTAIVAATVAAVAAAARKMMIAIVRVLILAAAARARARARALPPIGSEYTKTMMSSMLTMALTLTLMSTMALSAFTMVESTFSAVVFVGDSNITTTVQATTRMVVFMCSAMVFVRDSKMPMIDQATTRAPPAVVAVVALTPALILMTTIVPKVSRARLDR